MGAIIAFASASGRSPAITTMAWGTVAIAAAWAASYRTRRPDGAARAITARGWGVIPSRVGGWWMVCSVPFRVFGMRI